MVRDGMAEMLHTDGEIEVVGEAGDGREAIDIAARTEPDVVVLDVAMPRLDGRATPGRLLTLAPRPKVVIVTVLADRETVRELLRLGASAYLHKHASMRDLISTIHSVARDRTDGNVILSLPHSRIWGDGPTPPREELTAREAHVLLRAAKGHPNRRISEDLHVSETTVKRELSRVYEKLGVNSRAEATGKALAEGWISTHDIVR